MSKKNFLFLILELERFIANVEAKGENANNLKRHLIAASFRTKNLDKTLQIINKLEESKYNISTGVWAQLVDLYVHHNKSVEALELYDKIKSKEPEFLLDNMKTVSVVEMLLKEDRLEDALKFLDKNKKPQIFPEGEGTFNYMTTTWRILNSLAEKGDEQGLQRLFNALIEGNYVQPTNILLGPLIKVC